MSSTQGITTSLTRLLSEFLNHPIPLHSNLDQHELEIKTPIVSAPMTTVTTPDLVVGVIKAGGFGFLAEGLAPSQAQVQAIRSVRSKLDPKTPLSLADYVPVGFGFIGALLDQTETSDDPRLPAVLREQPAAVWFAFGDHLEKYVAQVRSYDAQRQHKTLIFVIVNTIQEAVRAVNDWKVDVLVAQGFEAGGHGRGDAPVLSLLLQGILATIPADTCPPVIAAGGVTTGAQMAGYLTMGAAGVVLGTRLLFTPECTYSSEDQEILLDADLHSTERGMAFDEVRGTLFWPQGVDGRAIANSVMQDVRDGLNLGERLRRYDEGKKQGSKDRAVVWAGAGVGLVNEIQTAEVVTRTLHDGAIKALREASVLLA